MKISVDYKSYSTMIDSATISQTESGRGELNFHVDTSTPNKKFVVSNGIDNSDIILELTFEEMKQFSSLITQFMKQTM